MTTLALSARRVKPTLTPTRTSRVLFDSTRRLQNPRRFGEGIQSLPTYRTAYTAADAAWAAQAFGELSDARGAEEFNQELEFRAAVAEAQDRLERGCLL
jgi:hypothetical protein